MTKTTIIMGKMTNNAYINLLQVKLVKTEQRIDCIDDRIARIALSEETDPFEDLKHTEVLAPGSFNSPFKILKIREELVGEAARLVDAIAKATCKSKPKKETKND